MKSRAILSLEKHRPWPLPTRPWIMRQQWHELLFAHWSLPAETISPLLPPGVALDTYDGQARIGIVPFRMAGVHPRAIVSLPWISACPELNVRTYVAIEDKPGVFFFSLDATNPVAVRLGWPGVIDLPRLPILPCQVALNIGSPSATASTRSTGAALYFAARFTMVPGRYSQLRLNYEPIRWHGPVASNLPEIAPLLHYSLRQDALVWSLEQVKTVQDH